MTGSCYEVNIEITNMILKHKDYLEPKLKKALNDYVFDLIGYMHKMMEDLPCGLPEYAYQEALATIISEHGIDPHKEHIQHIMFRGKEMDSYFRMDMMVERERGNIIIECKALEKLTSHERQQLFSYMIASGFPIGILANFATYPHAQIERYYFDKNDMTITAF